MNNIIDLKAELLVNGLSFDFESIKNFPNILKYKANKIRVSDRHFIDPQDEKRKYIFDELFLGQDDYKSVVKVYYNNKSPLKLFYENEQLIIKNKKENLNVNIEPLSLLEYAKKKYKGTTLDQFISVIGADRLAFLPFEGCEEWNCGNQCKFCGANPHRLNFSDKRPNITQIPKFTSYQEWWDDKKDFVKEGFRLAIKEINKEKIAPHKHFLAMSGNLLNINFVWDILYEIFTENSNVINMNEHDSYINAMPPFDFERLRVFKNELGFVNYSSNIECFDKNIFSQVCPGKANHIGYEHILDSLKFGVKIFGKGNVKTNLVLGAEPIQNVVKAAEILGKKGIVADYTVFYPRPGSCWNEKQSISKREILKVTEKMIKSQRKFGLKPFCCELSSRSSLENDFYNAMELGYD